MNKRPGLPVSTGRFSRMSRLAAGMAGGLITEGVRRWTRVERW